MSRYFPVLIIVLIFVSCTCNKKTLGSDQTTHLKQNCYDERENESKLENAKGKVIVLMETYFIETENSRLQPCELPQEFQKDGLKVTFSGDVKKILPTERRAGIPIHLSRIKLD